MKSYLLILLFLVYSNSALPKDSQIIGHFSNNQMNDWSTKTFKGETDYQIVTLDNTKVLRAESHASASGLFNKKRIDLSKTPYLNWRWQINQHLNTKNEQHKSGDDYSARIYVIIDGGWAFWKTKALNYVWAAASAKGDIWENAFAGKSAMMIALRSASDKTQTWYQERRNVKTDLNRLLGIDVRYIDGIALMTDTDNAKGDAIAYYGDIYFSED